LLKRSLRYFKRLDDVLLNEFVLKELECFRKNESLMRDLESCFQHLLIDVLFKSGINKFELLSNLRKS
jgi:hypothetical protein